MVISVSARSFSIPMCSLRPESAAVRPHAFTAVFSLLEPSFGGLDRLLREQLAEFEPEIRPMVEYCVDTSGKRIRPALVFLSGGVGGAVASRDLLRAAAVVELVHLASLVHDDIMDEADLRRNRPTAMREYGPEAAVLLGDALFAHALHLAAQFPTTAVCSAVSEAIRRVCAGEIVQTLRRGSLAVTRADYHRIVDLKTAELFRVSCHLGASLAGRAEGYVSAAARFGRHLGIAYQIYDDLADFFGEEGRIGKTLGTDLASGKLTLPLIALMERLPADAARELAGEITGGGARLELRLRQMAELDVFGAVTQEIEAELAKADGALRPWAAEPGAGRLTELGDVLRAQVAGLRRGAAA
jgi:octaprenyl-diphosphate synthase